MGNTAVTIIGIFLSGILLFVVPVMTMAEKKDETSNLSAQTATTEFTNKIRTSGVLSQEDYDNFIMSLAATGNAYDVEITIQKLDENPAKKSSGSTVTIGDKVYYVLYTTQVLDQLASATSHTMYLNEGDIISVKVKNTNKTQYEEFRDSVYRASDQEAGAITAQSAGMVTKTGK